MKNADNCGKYIYCIEGNWNDNPRSNQSVKPILDLLYSFYKVKYIYRKCVTRDEFLEGLQTFTQKRYSNYTILYIAYHGQKNCIDFGNDNFITLQEIANVLEGKLNGKIVHFGSCSTLHTSLKNIADFITRTGCSLMSGYRKDIEFFSGSAFELVYFELLQQFTSLRKIQSTVTKKYQTFVENIQFFMM